MSEVKIENQLTRCITENILTNHRGEQVVIRSRDDGWLCATDICKAGGKLFKHYNENASTKAFLNELSKKVVEKGGRNPGNENILVIDVIKGGNAKQQGTYIHPYGAIHIAMWANPVFAVNVIELVYRVISGDVSVITDISDHMVKIKAISEEEHNIIVNALNDRIHSLETVNNTLEIKCRNMRDIFIDEAQFIDNISNIRPIQLNGNNWTDNELRCALIKALNINGKSVKFIFNNNEDATQPINIIHNALRGDIGDIDKLRLRLSCKFIYNFIKHILYENEISTNDINYETINPDIFSKLIVIIYNKFMNRLFRDSPSKKNRILAENRLATVIRLRTERDEVIEERDEAIEERDEAIEERDEAIAALGEAIDERDRAEDLFSEADDLRREAENEAIEYKEKYDNLYKKYMILVTSIEQLNIHSTSDK